MRRNSVRLPERILRTCFSILAALSISSCADLKEVNDIQIATGLGIDEGENGQVCVTALLVNPVGKPGGQQSDGGPQSVPSSIVTECAPTIKEAVDHINEASSRNLILSHNAVTVFGRKYAESGILGALEFIERDRELRRTQVLLVSDTPATVLLNSRVVAEHFPALGYRRLAELGAKSSRTVDSLQATVSREFLNPSNTMILSSITLDDQSTPKSSGVALFKGDKWVASLTQAETTALLWMTGQAKQADITLPCPKASKPSDTMGVHLLWTKSRTRPMPGGSLPGFQIDVWTRAEITKMCSGEKVDEKQVESVEKLVESRMTEDMKRVLDVLHEHDVDAPQFGTSLFRSNPTAWRQVANRWDDVFPKAPVTIHAHVHILRTGLISGSPDTGFSREGYSPVVQDKKSS